MTGAQKLVENLNTDFAGRVATRLVELVEKHKVVGANLAVLHRGAIVAKCAAGYAHLGAGIESTTDTVFQIGSVTKVWTATVAMQLVEDGKLELDAPIQSVVPDLRLGTDELTEKVTLRHLLSHTSGINGDFLADTGRGDDNLEKYVALLKDVAANHPLGATMSYCNSGYSLLGRVLEVVTGVSWDQLMRDRLFTPLGLTHTGTLPEEALLHRAAIGHLGEPPTPVATWGVMRSAGPAGLITSTPSDVLTFAKMHLDGGVAADGTRIISAETAAAMLEPQVDVPDQWLLAKRWGLGWFLDDWDGAPVYGHDGGAMAQAAFLRVLPEHEFAICLFVNGGQTMPLYRDVIGELTAELTGVTMRPPIEPSPEPIPFDPADFVGHYNRTGVHTEILERGGRLFMKAKLVDQVAKLLGDTETEFEMQPFRENSFVVHRPEQGDTWLPAVFYDLPDGARYLHHAMRAAPKVG